ncbi:MAG TPA: xanthine dehydrogenase molybdopterin binding subunit [Bacteroidota bacterium]|nr:xanthine dehydrogenase molybdopterin binding subunit [Bacteroidota bacterium]
MSFSHESASKHVTGEAVYIDDILVNDQLLVGRVVYSPHAHARILSFDLSEAQKVPGVHAVLCHKDIPGANQMGPVVKDEPCLAADEVICVGQAIFLIAAETEEQCLEAERRIKVEYRPLDPILTLEKAIEHQSLLIPPRTMLRGEPDKALSESEHLLKGELRTGAAEHWYLETQVCLAVPGEGNELTVYASSQHPSETQALIAELLGIRRNEVVVEVRRMGGAFGGKETQGNHTACWSALLAGVTRRPVKIRLCRDDDQKITGKRHRFLSRYEAGFDNDGMLRALKVELNSDGGCATDLSIAILERAMLHVDNAYYVPHCSVVGNLWRTNLPSNTAFRGFGGPQGIAVMETVVDRIARVLKKDPSEIRQKNFYGIDSRNVTHYGQTVEHNRLFLLYDQLMASSEYARRRKETDTFNNSHEFLKRGMAITPVKFGISFTTSFLNQAGALVNVYGDGTILVNHGGTEMGQGLHTKIQRIAAAEFGVSVERVKVNATNTSKVPNTAATAASAGTDLNGMAVKNAIDTLKGRIAESMALYFSEQHKGDPSRPDTLVFEDDSIRDSKHPDRTISFVEAMGMMFTRQVSLSATGYYKTPGIQWDKARGWGHPFNYYAFGMCVSEVEVDVLTGGHTLLRTDILHDVGDSLNPLIDIGQVEGGYIQGVGWCTTEEIKWDEKGNLLTHSPDTYKIPSVQDIPKDFRVSLLKDVPNPNAIRKSKAVAEPPLMLGFSAWLAIKDAVSAVGNHDLEPDFSLPATNEVILLAVERIKDEVKARRGAGVEV